MVVLIGQLWSVLRPLNVALQPSVYLRDREGSRDRQTERAPIHWFIPEMAAVAGPRSGLEQGVQNTVQGTHVGDRTPST